MDLHRQTHFYKHPNFARIKLSNDQDQHMPLQDGKRVCNMRLPVKCLRRIEGNVCSLISAFFTS